MNNVKRFLWKNPDLSYKRRVSMYFAEIEGYMPLVHAVDKRAVFKKILESGKLILPKKLKVRSRVPLIDKYLGYDNAIFFSVGFAYSIDFNFQYGIVFHRNMLKETDYYSQPLAWQCYKNIIDFWFIHDKKYLDKLESVNHITKEVFYKYYFVKSAIGKTRNFFDFWKIEEILYQHILAYKNKNKLFNIAKKTLKENYKKYPSSTRQLMIDYAKWNPEIISKKDISLKNSYIKGFYIKEKDQGLELEIRKKYPKTKIWHLKDIDK